MNHASASPFEDPAVVRDQLGRDGFALCRSTGFRSEDDLLAVAGSVGSLDLGIDEELSGPPVMHVKYDPGKAAKTEAPAYFTSTAFPLHTDMSYVANPPRYMLMLCLVADAGGGGDSVVSDFAKAWGLLPAAHQAELTAAQFGFRRPPNTPAGDVGQLPVARLTPEWSMWRFRLDGMTVPERAREAVDAFHGALHQLAETFVLAAGDLVVVDNHRMAHGRTAFQPTPGTTPRHMLRAYAQDPARSLALLHDHHG